MQDRPNNKDDQTSTFQLLKTKFIVQNNLHSPLIYLINDPHHDPLLF